MTDIIPPPESIHSCEHCKKAVFFGDTALSENLDIICEDCKDKERDSLAEEGIPL